MTLSAIRLFLLSAIVPLSLNAFADNKKSNEEFDHKQSFNLFNQQTKQTFSAFSAANEKSYNEAFISAWQEFNQAIVEPVPNMPKPKTQPFVSSSQKTETSSKTSKSTHVQQQKVHLSYQGFYGHTLVQLPLTSLPKLSNITTRALRTFRQQALHNSNFNELLSFLAFMQQRTEAKTYATVLLSKQICKQYYAGNAAIACAWVLNQSRGSDVRLGMRDKQLLLLAASSQQWYERPFFNVQNQRFYVVNHNDYQRSVGPTQLQTQGHGDATKDVTIALSSELNPALKNTIKVMRFKQQLTIDSDHLAFLYQLPQLHISDYLNDNIPGYIKKQITPWITNMAANNMDRFTTLLSELQTLPYQIDDTQFGYEKPLTLTELLYFPYNDCEDRVYAMAAINKQWLGLELAALYYPGHLSAAIKINDQWLEADPTYQGASIGMRQPAYKNHEPEFFF
ncbi:hypothetical protein [Thalassotalea crassostreae]|uniref:hypothetical protein n=1 Tax=Thalassotalea crassostreae TaxID=1763536 RepID=UPI000839659E|nr:hypothetical protein [Thalassotalea crassostreae]